MAWRLIPTYLSTKTNLPIQPERCERREMPRSLHEKRVRATIMDDRACYEYPRRFRAKRSASPLHLPVHGTPWEPGGQTTHYADDALSDERKSRWSLRFFTISCSFFSFSSRPLLLYAVMLTPILMRKKKKRKKNSRNCQVHTSRAASIIAARRRLVTCLFSSEAQIHGNYCSLLANIHRHECTPRT